MLGQLPLGQASCRAHTFRPISHNSLAIAGAARGVPAGLQAPLAQDGAHVGARVLQARRQGDLLCRMGRLQWVGGRVDK